MTDEQKMEDELKQLRFQASCYMSGFTNLENALESIKDEYPMAYKLIKKRFKEAMGIKSWKVM